MTGARVRPHDLRADPTRGALGSPDARAARHVSRRGTSTILLLVAGLALAACGKYGPPVRANQPVPAVAPTGPAPGATTPPSQNKTRKEKPAAGSGAFAPETTP